MEILLEVQDICRSYGGVKALQNVNIQIPCGKIIGLIGPNGAGKTTLFNLTTGMDQPNSGQIFFSGNHTLNNKAPYQISRLGIARTFQNIRLFKELTVLENVMLGMHYQQGNQYNKGNRFIHALRSLLQHRELEDDLIKNCIYWLNFFQLESYKEEQADSLPYGKQRELEIARALASKPRLLFLDEPAAGMNPSETQELTQNIQRISDLGITVVLIEHDMHLVMQICQNIIVLHQGQKIAEGNPQEIRNNPTVIEAYLGDSATQETPC